MSEYGESKKMSNGLGPHNSSLLKRTGAPLTVIADGTTLTRMKDEQYTRTKMRLIARINYSKKMKKPGKPLALVRPLDKEKGQSRYWEWLGETIDSQGLKNGGFYSTECLRQLGYSLPRISNYGRAS